MTEDEILADVVNGVHDNAFRGAIVVDRDRDAIYMLDDGRLLQVGAITNRTEVDDQDHDITTEDYYLAVINLSAARTLALPSTASTGRTYIVKDASGLSGTYNITIDSGGNTIDGVTDYVMSTNYESITLVFDGTSNWEVWQ